MTTNIIYYAMFAWAIMFFIHHPTYYILSLPNLQNFLFATNVVHLYYCVSISDPMAARKILAQHN